jgi:hypothetical protein
MPVNLVNSISKWNQVFTASDVTTLRRGYEGYLRTPGNTFEFSGHTPSGVGPERERSTIRTTVAEGYPEQSVHSVKARARLSAFQHGELLAQGDVFQAQPVTGENQPSQISGEEPHKREHASIFADRNYLIQHTFLILMIDTDYHGW